MQRKPFTITQQQIPSSTQMKETATVLWNRPGEFYFYLLSQLHLLHSSLCTVPVLEPLGNSASCTRICNPMASTTQCRNISRGTREKVKEEKEEALGRPSNCLMKTSNADWLKTISTGGSGGIGCATSAWCFYVSPASRYRDDGLYSTISTWGTSFLQQCRFFHLWR